MAYLEIKLFGTFEVHLSSSRTATAASASPSLATSPEVDASAMNGGAMVTGFRSNKARALLAYLAVEANRPVMRSRLATLLWGDYPEAQARKSLRNVLANLRDILNPLLTVEPPILTIDRQTVQLSVNQRECIVDVVQFDQLLHNAESAVSNSSTQSYLTQAVALYQGELLAGMEAIDSPDFEEWRVVQQEVRHRQVLQALSQLTERHLDQHDFLSVLNYARQQLQLEPWQENAHRQLIYALAAQGDRSGALTQFDSCCKILQRELGVHPEAATLTLIESIKSGSFVVAPKERASGTIPPTNIRTSSDQISDGATAAGQQQPQISTAQGIPSKAVRILSRLEPLPDQELFGIERARARIHDVLQRIDRPWLVAIDGIGGIGKTTLATLLVHGFVQSDRFGDIAWVSAKQEEFRPAIGIAETGRPALDVETLTTLLLEQLLDKPPLTASQQEKHQILRQRLLDVPTLVVVDNLESVPDYQALVPYLRQLVNPSKCLITSRLTLQSYSDIFCYSLTELEEEDAHSFLRYEATVRNSARLANASQDELHKIYQFVGGNPLALKLVIGQLTFLPLSHVLDNLRDARGKRVDQLYTYIYWQAWQMLTEQSRQLLLSLPLAPNGTFAQLALVSELEIDELQEGLAQLNALSLVQTSGDLNEPRYRLHRLTETFLMTEVIQWQ